MKNKYQFITLVVFISFAIAGSNKFWDEKDYQTWSEEECKQLLSESPWAFSKGFANFPGKDPNFQGVEESFPIIIGPEFGPDVITDAGIAFGRGFGHRDQLLIFEFRLISAKPVIAAFARLQKLTRPEEVNMEQTERFINSVPEKEILVQIGYRVTTTERFGQLLYIHNYFGKATLAEFQQSTYLQTGKDKFVSLSKYYPWNKDRSNPVFVFPRLDENGEPFFTGDEKSIILKSKIKPGGQEYSIHIKMEPKKMVYRGTFSF